MSARSRLLALAVPILLMCEPLRTQAEASMLRHMLAVFPLLFASGYVCAGAIGERVRAAFAHWDSHGISGLVFVSAVLTVWMIPNALDMATTGLPVDLAKTVSVFAAGLVFALSVSRASAVIQLFFVGQWATMTIFVGVLFQSLPSRLCAAYLQTDQARTGEGLVALATIVAGTWAFGAWRTQARESQQA
ncbi:hypothetical protein [Steroidobacter cummioxidans]|uniref:hypothetical protein n=1 Tax=Steroidobacter cummioxidans TaxID=1803913 RepID=UPI000E31FF1E|nr:hypothetical protein [Steroidobacter cummioxidans]